MRIPLLLGAACLVAALPSSTAPQLLARNDVDLSQCPGYSASNVVVTNSSLTADLKIRGSKCNVYAEDLEELKLVVEHQTNNRLHVKIYDAGLNMYQVQEHVVPRPPNNNAQSQDSAVRFDLREEPFSFKVTRNDNGEVLFDTAKHQLIYESQYIRVRTRLPTTHNLYGLGEHSDAFRFSENYTRTFWNSEAPGIPNDAPLYGSHPVYFDHRGDKGTHGVFLFNANGMDIVVGKDGDDAYLEYNVLGGVMDLYFMAGPEPTAVSKQYAEIVGLSAMYPYWTLGFHQCKYGYWDVNMVAEVVANHSKAGIPLEVMWTDIDYMELRRDFTLDALRFPLHKMRELVNTLHERNQRYVLILDPAIPATLNLSEYQPYARGKELDIFLKQKHDGPDDYLGVQWAGVQAWPDWFHPKAEQWWTREIAEAFNSRTGIDLDGVWVDMNEASNFCPDVECNPAQHAQTAGIPPEPKNAPRRNTGRPIEGFPESFQPEFNTLRVRDAPNNCPRRADFNQMKGTIGRDVLRPKYNITNPNAKFLSDKTIYTSITNCDGTQQYDTHNLYGHMMSQTTYNAMLSRRPSLRPFVLTRSTFAGSGRKAAHWFGDNASTWDHYRTSIRQMLAFVAMHQMPMVGSDICGFNYDANPTMCARWIMLGAFQPFYRNHAADNAINQEFYIWPETTKAAIKAIDLRYRLLDYAYTALWRQTQDGTPMINPLFFLYPNDNKTFGIQSQWFYGDALLISPVYDDDADYINAYLPNDIWYDLFDHSVVDSPGDNVRFEGVQLDEIAVHIRGGTIVPLRAKSGMTTTEVRKQPFEILIAPGRDGKAKGRLYVDDGESLEQNGVTDLEFEWDGSQFTITGEAGLRSETGEEVKIARVVLMGQYKDLGVGTWDAQRNEVIFDGPAELAEGWGIAV
ncbi:glycoside hydrolase family 31 protein [Sporormia fimetaria CBS 119925]|uniref:alpha-glucosidase n=1 Tax=Sporormia fimetaria CBS 119925 TaxID=1340428 RepID=A0A6A6V2H7_9PLEO|nr:glycoside hydrolase family 31 protein [Sporormia fimetaria CBS 119925]